MNDEASKLPETPDTEPHSLKPGHVHPIAKGSPESTIFTRFVQKMGMIFTRTPSENELILNGRIKELQTMADSVLLELLEFKKELAGVIDPDLYALVITILDPLIKETGHVPPVIEKKDNTAQQVKLFSRYVDSVERGKVWIEIGKVNQEKEKLEQALIQQIAGEFLFRIDRDIQVIQDYLSHSLASFEMSNVLKDELKEKLMPDLAPKLLELYQLKNLPSDLSLNSFIQWRADSDRSREIIFGAALHIIDHFSDVFLPSPKKEQESAHQQAILADLNALGEKLNEVAAEMAKAGRLNDTKRQVYMAVLQHLEEEAHHLNCNLRLSQEHGEQIEEYLDTIVSLREDLMY